MSLDDASASAPGKSSSARREWQLTPPRAKSARLNLSAAVGGPSFESVIHPQAQAEEPIVSIENFSLWYGAKQALHSVSAPIPRGQVIALIGPSGCGKSTLLRCINRMNDLIAGVRIEGDIRMAGESIYGPGVDVIGLRKRAGMVFQKPNPFPKSIFDNVVYALRVAGVRDKHKLRQACEETLKSAALWEEVKDRLQDSGGALSGGQQQRLCFARALAAKPELLLLDEPCSALDPIATSKIENLIRELRGEYSIIVVTHNMQQAARISDYTAFMYLGRLVEFGPTSEIFTNPKVSETEDYITGRFG